jgi:hypothetical protein
MAERNKLSQIPSQRMPERPTNFLSRMADEAIGAFERYGRRSGAQRDASLAILNQAVDPNTDPLTGAGMKALGLAGLVTHPLAFFPTREEWDQRLEAAGNTGRVSRSIGGFLSDLPSLIDPQMAAGGAALAAAPLIGKMAGKVDDVAGAGRASTMTDWKDNLFTKQVDPNSLTFKESMQNNTSAIDEMFPKTSEMFPALVTRSPDGELSIIDGHNRAKVAMSRGDQLPALEIPNDVYETLKGKGFDDMQITHAMLQRAGQTDAADGIRSKFVGLDREFFKADDEIDRIIEAAPKPRKELLTQSYKEVYPDGTVKFVPGTLRVNPPAKRFNSDMSVAERRRLGDPPKKDELRTQSYKEQYEDGTEKWAPGTYRVKRHK